MNKLFSERFLVFKSYEVVNNYNEMNEYKNVLAGLEDNINYGIKEIKKNPQNFLKHSVEKTEVDPKDPNITHVSIEDTYYKKGILKKGVRKNTEIFSLTSSYDIINDPQINKNEIENREMSVKLFGTIYHFSIDSQSKIKERMYYVIGQSRAKLNLLDIEGV